MTTATPTIKRVEVDKINLKAIMRYRVGNGMFIHTQYTGTEMTKEKLEEIVGKASRRGERVYYQQYNMKKGIVAKGLFG